MKRPVTTHERLTSEEKIEGSSDRSFGIVFTAVFTIIGLWPLINESSVRLWSLSLALVLALITAFQPLLFAPFNRVWTKLALVLHHVVNPVIMALVFYATVMPTGLAMRLMGKDVLQLRFQPEKKSYWIERRPPGPTPETMKNQF